MNFIFSSESSKGIFYNMQRTLNTVDRVAILLLSFHCMAIYNYHFTLQKFYNCSCFPPAVDVATNGGCSAQCNLMYVFMPLFLFTMVFTFLNNVPLIEATFR